MLAAQVNCLKNEASGTAINIKVNIINKTPVERGINCLKSAASGSVINIKINIINKTAPEAQANCLKNEASGTAINIKVDIIKKTEATPLARGLLVECPVSAQVLLKKQKNKKKWVRPACCS